MSGHLLAHPHPKLKEYVERVSAGECGIGGMKDGDAAVVLAQLVESLPSMHKALGSMPSSV